MKYLSALILSLIITGCAVMIPTERTITKYFTDYREFSAEGFLITPNPYNQDCVSIGELEIIVTPAFKQYPEEGQAYDSRGKYFDFEDIDYNDVVRIAVEEAKNMGADAITNFSIRQKEISKIDKLRGATAYGYEYRITGYCIKRK